jgi:hypothetical protein
VPFSVENATDDSANAVDQDSGALTEIFETERDLIASKLAIGETFKILDIAFKSAGAVFRGVEGGLAFGPTAVTGLTGPCKCCNTLSLSIGFLSETYKLTTMHF